MIASVFRISKRFLNAKYGISSLSPKIRFDAIHSAKSYSIEKAELTKGEKIIYDKLKTKFPLATYIDVVDMSGGCGGMYNIVVCTPEFKDIRIVKQHQIVNEALKEELASLHGWRIQTSDKKDLTDEYSES